MTDRRPCLKCAAKGWRDSMYDHATRDHDRLLAEAKEDQDANESGSEKRDADRGVPCGTGSAVDGAQERGRGTSGGAPGGSGAGVRSDAPAYANEANPVARPLPPAWAAAVAASEAREDEPDESEDALPGAGASTLDLDLISREAAQLASGPFGFFLWLERRLTAAGFPPVSPWWLKTLREFYASGKRWLVVMAGRGAGKSTMLTRVAVAEALFTFRSAPPGETWIWPFVSVTLTDARNRIKQIATILGAVGIHVKPREPQGHPTIDQRIIRNEKGKATAEDLTDLRGNKIAFVAFAGTIAALSGPTSIGATVDEEAKLRGEGSVNPSGEVIVTLLNTFRARPGIRGIRCSSAWKTEGSHYGAIKKGSNIANHVAAIGAEFLPPTLAGLESVARWEEQHGDSEAAAKIRAHAATLTPESPNAPSWLGNPTLGNENGQPWDGAAVAGRLEYEAIDDETFAQLFPGMTRAEAWLRENASVPVKVGGLASDALSAARVTVADSDTPMSDVVIGVAPSEEGAPEWGIIIAGVCASGFIALADHSLTDTSGNVAGMLAVLGTSHRASVLVVAKEHEQRLNAEIAAGLSGLGTYAPPVCAVSVYDGQALRTGPVRSLLDAERLRIAKGLTGLVRAIGGHRPGVRSARVEALAVAVTRLVACYPWAAETTEPKPVKGPMAATSIVTSRGVPMMQRRHAW